MVVELWTGAGGGAAEGIYVRTCNADRQMNSRSLSNRVPRFIPHVLLAFICDWQSAPDRPSPSPRTSTSTLCNLPGDGQQRTARLARGQGSERGVGRASHPSAQHTKATPVTFLHYTYFKAPKRRLLQCRAPSRHIEARRSQLGQAMSFDRFPHSNSDCPAGRLQCTWCRLGGRARA